MFCEWVYFLVMVFFMFVLEFTPRASIFEPFVRLLLVAAFSVAVAGAGAAVAVLLSGKIPDGPPAQR